MGFVSLRNILFADQLCYLIYVVRYSYSYNGPDAIASTQDGNYMILGGGNLHSGYALTKIQPDGKVVWSLPSFVNFVAEIFGPIGLLTLSNGVFVASGYSGIASSSTVYVNHFLSIIDDRYAYKSVPFTFTIPGSDDSLLRTYTPVKVPSGMTVSKGGTISWTPQTDSVYMEHVAFLVTKDTTVKDSLTFNIFVNSQYHPNKTTNPVSRSVNSSLNSISIHSISSGEVRFSLPSGASSLRVYDLRGQLLENLSVRNNQATWLPNHRAGRYFAKAIFERGETVKGFTVVR